MCLYDRIVTRPLSEATRSPGLGYTGHWFAPVDYYGNTQWSPPIERDYVAQMMEWRRRCPDYGKPGHASFCERCDELLFRAPVGGVDWIRRDLKVGAGGGAGAWPEP